MHALMAATTEGALHAATPGSSGASLLPASPPWTAASPPSTSLATGVSSEPHAEEFFVRNPTYLTVEGAVFRPLRTTHASLIARDFEAMYDFYTGFVGLKPFAGGRSSDFAILAGSHSSGDVVLHRPRKGAAPGLHHVGVLVRDEKELDQAQGALSKVGVKIDSQTDHPSRRALTIIDPDRMRVQMYVNRDWRASNLAAVDPELALKLL